MPKLGWCEELWVPGCPSPVCWPVEREWSSFAYSSLSAAVALILNNRLSVSWVSYWLYRRCLGERERPRCFPASDARVQVKHFNNVRILQSFCHHISLFKLFFPSIVRFKQETVPLIPTPLHSLAPPYLHCLLEWKYFYPSKARLFLDLRRRPKVKLRLHYIACSLVLACFASIFGLTQGWKFNRASSRISHLILTESSEISIQRRISVAS